MTRQSGEGAVNEAKQRPIVALEENPRAEQLHAATKQRRRSFTEGVGLYLGIQRVGIGFHDWLLLVAVMVSLFGGVSPTAFQGLK
jgi:hypothetical protein